VTLSDFALNDEHMESKHWLAMLQVQDVSTLQENVSRHHVLVKLFMNGATVCERGSMPVLLVCPRPFTSSWATSNK
jgi:hypothetical protein